MIIDGNAKARQLTSKLKKETDELIKNGVVPGFGIILVGDDPASHLYVAMKMRLASELGFYCRHVKLSKDALEEDVIRQLQALQSDSQIHGVIVQIPLPAHVSLKGVCEKIYPQKDIDCLHPDNLKALSLKSKPYFWPPTAESVVYLIGSTKTSLKKNKVVVVGTGFFAKQIAALCFVKGARTKNVSSSMSTVDRNKITRNANIVVSVVGRPGIITGDSIKKGSIVIDVGATKVGTKTIGDIDIVSVMEKARAVSPVPGGVGPITVVMLMKNVVKAAKRLTKTT